MVTRFSEVYNKSYNKNRELYVSDAVVAICSAYVITD